MRDAFVKTLLEIAREDARVMLVTGDLGFGVLTPFWTELPRQFINVGVAEQNLTGIATGLALSGHVVYTYSIANFPTLRCLEQVRNDACYHQANVKIVAIGGGFSYGALGISHHATEDLAILRSLPDLTVMAPCDIQETIAATRGSYTTPGTCYLRLDKSCAPELDGSAPAVVPGGVRLLWPGRDVVILGVGGIVEEALQAAEQLRGECIDCAVYSVHTIKPIDAEGVVRAARQAPLVLALEEHTVDGGLGGAVAEVFADAGWFPPMYRRVGLRAGFSSVVGSQSHLRERYGLNAASLSATIRDTLRSAAVRTAPSDRALQPG